MKVFYITFLFFVTSYSNASNVITCGNVLNLPKNSEAKYTLHMTAQKRAQTTAENFIGKKLKKPFFSFKDSLMLNKKKSTLEDMIPIIETFWCETLQTPLHSAYYRFYMSNKEVW